jgi:transcriptional regulator with XRE-family HTH domain
MIHFNNEFLTLFPFAVRKYMAIRGIKTQKELSEKSGVNETALTRLLRMSDPNRIDEDQVAIIMAALNISISEVADGVQEGSEAFLRKLIELYKVQPNSDAPEETGPDERNEGVQKAQASIKVGGRSQQVQFGEVAGTGSRTQMIELQEKWDALPFKHRDYVMSFMKLDINERDLLIDIGSTFFKYLEHRVIK